KKKIIRAVVSLNAHIDGVSAEHAANRYQAKDRKKKKQRDWATFGALLSAAIPAIITLIFAHLDNRAIIRESRRTADQQHNDTVAALAKTDAAIAETKRLADEA